MRRAQSSLCLRDETLAGGQRRKLSSRFPVGRSSESFSPGDTPRQRFRQRRPGPLGAPSSHGKGEGEGSLGAYRLLGGGGFPPGSCVCPPTLLPQSGPHGPVTALCPQDLAWDGAAPSRPWRNTKQMPTERVSGGLGGRRVFALPVPLAGLVHPFTHLTMSLSGMPGDVLLGNITEHSGMGAGRQPMICIKIIVIYNSLSNRTMT